MSDAPTPHDDAIPTPETMTGEAVDDGRGRIFPCPECGADLVFHIGQQKLSCPQCGSTKEIVLDEDQSVEEQDYESMLQQLAEQREDEQPAEHNEVRCESCGSHVIFEGTLTSTSCPYCGSPIQREQIHRGGFRIPVNGMLVFQVEHRKAKDLVSDWIRSRWFAPNDFKRVDLPSKFHSTFLPFWTFDSLTFTSYRGERGDSYTTTVGSGKNRRTVTKIRWSPRSGSFQRFFDDVLINASTGVPVQLVDSLAPWPLNGCHEFTPQYLAGHFARTYDVELPQAFGMAKQRIESELRSDCCRRIGGTHQRLHMMNARFDAISFKHLLLPVWLLAYQYKDKTYRVLINGVTGRVSGDRPYSWVKILSLILAILFVVGTFVLISKG